MGGEITPEIPMKPFLLTLLALLAAPVVLAQPIGVEVTPTVGFRTGGTIAWDVTDVFGNDVKTDDSASFGVIVDIDLSRYWQLEFLVNHQRSDLQLKGGLFQPELNVGDIDVTYWQAGIVYRHPIGNVNPFFGFTLGGATLDPKVTGLESENRFSGSLGGGVKIFFNRNLGVRFEGRGYWTAIDTRSSGCCYNDYWGRNDDFVQAEASAGLILAF
jgi:hypothetical protein